MPNVKAKKNEYQKDIGIKLVEEPNVNDFYTELNQLKRVTGEDED
jgi:hypothetical protein